MHPSGQYLWKWCYKQDFNDVPRGYHQGRLAMLNDQVQDETIGREVSLRLLRHFSSWVRHQQYHDTDNIRIRIENTDSLSYEKTWN